MSVAQQTFQSPTQNQSSVQNNLQKPKLLLRTYRLFSGHTHVYFSIWTIMSKVRIEASFGEQGPPWESFHLISWPERTGFPDMNLIAGLLWP